VEALAVHQQLMDILNTAKIFKRWYLQTASNAAWLSASGKTAVLISLQVRTATSSICNYFFKHLF
jgi:hypothetical protein